GGADELGDRGRPWGELRVGGHRLLRVVPVVAHDHLVLAPAHPAGGVHLLEVELLGLGEALAEGRVRTGEVGEDANRDGGVRHPGAGLHPVTVGRARPAPGGLLAGARGDGEGEERQGRYAGTGGYLAHLTSLTRGMARRSRVMSPSRPPGRNSTTATTAAP